MIRIQNKKDGKGIYASKNKSKELRVILSANYDRWEARLKRPNPFNDKELMDSLKTHLPFELTKCIAAELPKNLIFGFTDKEQLLEWFPHMEHLQMFQDEGFELVKLHGEYYSSEKQAAMLKENITAVDKHNLMAYIQS